MSNDLLDVEMILNGTSERDGPFVARITHQKTTRPTAPHRVRSSRAGWDEMIDYPSYPDASISRRQLRWNLGTGPALNMVKHSWWNMLGQHADSRKILTTADLGNLLGLHMRI